MFKFIKLKYIAFIFLVFLCINSKSFAFAQNQPDLPFSVEYNGNTYTCYSLPFNNANNDFILQLNPATNRLVFIQPQYDEYLGFCLGYADNIGIELKCRTAGGWCPIDAYIIDPGDTEWKLDPKRGDDMRVWFHKASLVYLYSTIPVYTDDSLTTVYFDGNHENVVTPTPPNEEEENNNLDFSSGGVFSWLFDALQAIINFFTSIVNALNPFSEDFILNGLFTFLGDALSYINPFSENFILNDVLSFLGSILDYLNPFSENFIGTKIVQGIGDLLEFLFVPSEEVITNLTDSVKEKFAFINTIHDFAAGISSSFDDVNGSHTLTVNVDSKYYTGELKILDLSWFAPFKEYSDMIITAFIYLFFIWRLYTHLSGIISGSSTIIEINKGG